MAHLAVQWCNSVVLAQKWAGLVILSYDVIAICTPQIPGNPPPTPTWLLRTYVTSRYVLIKFLRRNRTVEPAGHKRRRSSNQNSLRMCKKITMILQRLTLITVLLAVNAVSTILSQCQQGQTQAEDIICTVNRNALLPSPTVALVHCETDQPGGLLLLQADALNVENTRWMADQKACFFRAGESCTHFFLRIDSPLTKQEHINICRFNFPVPVCTCINLTGKSVVIHENYYNIVHSKTHSTL